MFEKEKADFYRKYILLMKESFKYSLAFPVIEEIVYIQFRFHKGEEIENINYLCSPLTESSFEDHGANIDEIFRVCVGCSTGNMPFIFPVFCQECGKIYYTRMRCKNKNTRICLDCSSLKIESIIKGDKEKGDISYVYLMQSDVTKLLKIGYSTNPQSRAKHLSTGNGGDVKILNLIRGGVKLERFIHKLFNEYNINREWYKDMLEIREYFNSFRV